MRINCVICLSAIGEEDKATAIVNCGHVFHYECLTEWMQKGGARCECPTCRGAIMGSTHSSMFLLEKLHFSIDNNSTWSGEDYAALQEANAKLAQVKESFSAVQTKLERLREETKRIERQLEQSFAQNDLLSDEIDALRKQNRLLEKAKAKSAHLAQDNKELTDKVQLYSKIDDALKAKQCEIDDFCNQFDRDPAVGLKKVASMYKVTQSHYNKCISRNHDLKLELRKQQQENAKSSATCVKLQEQLETREAELSSLRELTQTQKKPNVKKIVRASSLVIMSDDEEEDATRLPAAVIPPIRSVASPFPRKAVVLSDDSSSDDDSPITNRFKRMASNHGYLARKSQKTQFGVAIVSCASKASMVKKQEGYDGMGGHSKEFVSLSANVYRGPTSKSKGGHSKNRPKKQSSLTDVTNLTKRAKPALSKQPTIDLSETILLH